MSNTTKLRERRLKLWDERGGLCHWCGIKTTIEQPADGRLSKTAATIDHLFSRLSPARQYDLEVKQRWLLSCYSCNQKRNDEEHTILHEERCKMRRSNAR